jgi:hypothetical protein
MEEAYWAGRNSRNPDLMAKLITDDFVIINRSGVKQIREKFLTDLKDGRFTAYGPEVKYEIPTDLLVRFYGASTAVVTFSEMSPYGPRGSERVPTLHQITHVWVQLSGKGWRLASRHSSVPPFGRSTP